MDPCSIWGACQVLIRREPQELVLAAGDCLRQNRRESDIFEPQFDCFPVRHETKRIQRRFADDDVLGRVLDDTEPK